MSKLMSATVLVASLFVSIPESDRYISQSMVATVVILNGNAKLWYLELNIHIQYVSLHIKMGRMCVYVYMYMYNLGKPKRSA